MSNLSLKRQNCLPYFLPTWNMMSTSKVLEHPLFLVALNWVFFCCWTCGDCSFSWWEHAQHYCKVVRPHQGNHGYSSNWYGFSHRGNPSASLKLERLYGTPVLLSGLASLVLTDEEYEAVHHHHKLTLQRLQRLHIATPECVVMFLAGSLPATALLHLRMLGLLGMIASLGPDNILNNHGRHILLSASTDKNCKSWFLSVRTLCQQYSLSDPLLIL